MELVSSRDFANGSVYCLKARDGRLVEVTDTFLPYYTKDAIGRKQNILQDGNIGSRAERWMIGVSCMSGCPVRCKFCATGQMKKCRPLTAYEIVDQVAFVWGENYVSGFLLPDAKEYKINYTRMGEPFLNIEAVKQAIDILTDFEPETHHYLSTIGVQGSDFSWIKDNITLQISLHSLNEERRRELIPFKKLMSIEELGQIRTKSNQKTTVNLTLVDDEDFDIDLLKRYFDPEHFFIKLSPINKNAISEANGLGNGIISAKNLL